MFLCKSPDDLKQVPRCSEWGGIPPPSPSIFENPVVTFPLKYNFLFGISILIVFPCPPWQETNTFCADILDQNCANQFHKS